MTPFLIAHRGDTSNYPENTIEAFQSAFDKGADGIELDTWLHSNQMIVVHDYYFDKGKPYPLLSEVLEKFANKGRLEIEVKALDLQFIPQLKNTLVNYQDADIEITTSNFVLLPALRESFPRTSLGVIFSPNYFAEWMKQDFMIEYILGVMNITKANVAHVPIFFEELVRAVRNNGNKFHRHIATSSLDEEMKQFQEAIALGVEQCTFDDINLLEEVKSKQVLT